MSHANLVCFDSQINFGFRLNQLVSCLTGSVSQITVEDLVNRTSPVKHF